jgi:hypothetical protein
MGWRQLSDVMTSAYVDEAKIQIFIDGLLNRFYELMGHVLDGFGVLIHGEVCDDLRLINLFS